MTDVIGLLGYFVMGVIFAVIGSSYSYYYQASEISAAVLNFYEKLFLKF